MQLIRHFHDVFTRSSKACNDAGDPQKRNPLISLEPGIGLEPTTC